LEDNKSRQLFFLILFQPNIQDDKGGGRIEMEQVLRNHCSAAFECKKPCVDRCHMTSLLAFWNPAVTSYSLLLTPHLQQQTWLSSALTMLMV